MQKYLPFKHIHEAPDGIICGSILAYFLNLGLEMLIMDIQVVMRVIQ
jgi:hypothetical protein